MPIVDQCRRMAFVAGLLILALAMGVGIVDSWSTQGRFPPVYIDYTDDLEKQTSGSDYAAAVDGLRLAGRLDHYGHRPRHYFELCKLAYRAGDDKNQRHALDELRTMFASGGGAHSRIHYYLSVAITLQPSVQPDGLLEALALAWEATQIEPDFAPGHAHLGQLLAVLATTDRDQPDMDSLHRAAVASRHALALDPSNSDARRTLTEIETVLRSIPRHREP